MTETVAGFQASAVDTSSVVLQAGARHCLRAMETLEDRHQLRLCLAMEVVAMIDREVVAAIEVDAKAGAVAGDDGDDDSSCR